MIGITGKNSNITKEFLLDNNEEVVFGKTKDLSLTLDSYLLCAGVLFGKSITDITEEEALETLQVNYIDVVKFCDKLFETNDKARVCIIGSYSGYKGSYDGIYAGSKAALHLYVETKKLKSKDQHLVCVAPNIIEDTGMTQRRTDLADTLARGKKRRLGRWLNSKEVARTVKFALNEDSLCNSVIKVTGGNW